MTMRSESAAGPPAPLPAGELARLFAAVHDATGFDPGGYAEEYRQAKVLQALRTERVENLDALQARLLRGKKSMLRFLSLFAADGETLFSEPSLFISLRNVVIPGFRYAARLRVWNPGCGPGAMAVSLAVLFLEEGLYDRTRIFATDVDDLSLQAARAGALRRRTAEMSARNYARAGGKALFSNYCSFRGETPQVQKTLLDRIYWARYNPATDASFNQFHMILLGRPLSDYAGPLRERTLRLFYESLTVGGVLGLAHAGGMPPHPYANCYRPLEESGKLYRKFR